MINLTENEKESIMDLVETYRSLHDKIAETMTCIESMEKEMERLKKEKESILTQMQTTHDREGMMFKDLADKYGEGKLDIAHMAWLTKNKKDENTTK